MKRIIVFILIASVYSIANGQSKGRKYFKMPSNVEYSRGRVLVKIKSEYKDELTQLAASASPTQVKNVAVKSVAHMVKPELDRYGASRKGARLQNPTVDISKYFSIAFEKNQNVEDYVNQLYATGYFEIVEPEYTYKSTFQPNDPSISDQYYLATINAFSAWDITQGDTSVVIAIVDSGGNLTHSDIAPNLYRNWKEYPPNGKDDDGNGYIDDYQGWDFMGSDTLNINNSNFVGDNDPSIKEGGDESHGTMVAGCASGRANNGIGIAGVGFKSRLMFTKHSADNQKTTDGSVYNAYAGLLYAANLGDVKIINCSFGGSGQSQIIQDLINYVVVDRNCLIVAAAGNSGNNKPSYPAAYDNVLSAAATDSKDVAATFTNFGNTVDISAPGVAIYTTAFNNDYNTVDGTSFSTPITSGAAALVWAKNPTFTALQVGEQLRVTADANALYTANRNYINQLGKGRLDIKNALTLELPSIRASNPKLVNQNGAAAVPGDKAFLSFDFKNFLVSTSGGIQISISTTSKAVQISKATVTPGIIGEGATVSNKISPFELTISSNAAQNTVVDLLITYSDGAYSDYQYQSFYVNPSFIDVNSNLITTTVTGIGRLAYQDTENSAQGSGFIFNQSSMVYEMGLIMGTSATNIYNNVRGINSKFDEDFVSTASIKQITPGVRSYSEIFGTFSNSTATTSQAVVVGYRSMVMKESPYDKFVIMEYKVNNPTANALSNFYFGMFADWDITTNGQQDAANWDATHKLGYVYPAQTAAKPIGGIQVLTGTPVYYAIDNDQTITGNPFGLYDGFTKTEKFTTISTQRLTAGQTIPAGQTTAPGNDVSHVVSSGPYTLAAGQTITLAFAIHAAANLTDLKTSAMWADSLYNFTMQAPVLASQNLAVCYNSPITLNATGATTIKWYDSFTGGQLLQTGPQLTTGNLKSDTAFYISDADHTYESVRAAIVVKAKANPTIFTSRSPILCQGDTVNLSVASADSTIWSNGSKTNTIKVYTAGSYSVKVKDNTLSCASLSNTISVVVNPKPTANFTFSGTLETQLPISFTDQSTGASTWFWDFGDGQNSTSQNPTHTYTSPANSVKLTITSANGCTDTKTNSVVVITAVEESQSFGVTTYPNPIGSQGLNVDISNEDLSHVTISFTNAMGQLMYTQEISSQDKNVQITIPSSALVDGLYIVKLNVGNKTIVRKVLKVQ
jgi:subtilisin family serine protease/PKD repeat protein